MNSLFWDSSLTTLDHALDHVWLHIHLHIYIYIYIYICLGIELGLWLGLNLGPSFPASFRARVRHCWERNEERETYGRTHEWSELPSHPEFDRRTKHDDGQSLSHSFLSSLFSEGSSEGWSEPPSEPNSYRCCEHLAGPMLLVRVWVLQL